MSLISLNSLFSLISLNSLRSLVPIPLPRGCRSTHMVIFTILPNPPLIRRALEVTSSLVGNKNKRRKDENLSSFELLTRLELVTSSLPRKCSTTELQQQLTLIERCKSRQENRNLQTFRLFFLRFFILRQTPFIYQPYSQRNRESSNQHQKK